MSTNSGTPRRSKRYYVITGAFVVVVNVIAFIFSDRALWAMVLAGALLGGFLVGAVADWVKHRRTKGADDSERPR